MPELRTTQFSLNKSTVLTALQRGESNCSLFAVREIDVKVFRTPAITKNNKEQEIRASIKQTIANLKLRAEKASKPELNTLKSKGIISKRSPSCTLLRGSDTLKLLRSLNKSTHAQTLEAAFKRDKYESDEEGEDISAESVYMSEESCNEDDEDEDMSEGEGSEGEGNRKSLWDERKQSTENEENNSDVRRSARNRKTPSKLGEEQGQGQTAGSEKPATEEQTEEASRKRKADEGENLESIAAVLGDLKSAEKSNKRQKKEESEGAGTAQADEKQKEETVATPAAAPAAATTPGEAVAAAAAAVAAAAAATVTATAHAAAVPAAGAAAAPAAAPAAAAAAPVEAAGTAPAKAEVPNHGENDNFKLLPYPIVLLLHKLKGSASPPPPALPLLYNNTAAAAMQQQFTNPQFYNPANLARYQRNYPYQLYMQNFQNQNLQQLQAANYQQTAGNTAATANTAAAVAAASNWVNAPNQSRRLVLEMVARAQSNNNANLQKPPEEKTDAAGVAKPDAAKADEAKVVGS
mmetsp:Transcript_19555/g.38728  ORF Transcript_19555/g.38728 Transcript_19555/m.38728 type:complete len:522 (+) Transcript_19555:29-1594(+)